MSTFTKVIELPVSAARAFAWHAHNRAFERLSPPWDAFEVLEKTGGIKTGARLAFKIKALGPIGLTWRAKHTAYEEDKFFRDEQDSGPFAHWIHTHSFEELGPDSCRLKDEIDYAPPLGAIGRLAAGWHIRSMLKRTFAYRHRLTRDDLEDHNDGGPPLTIAISGASGLIGRALVAYLGMGGHRIKPVVRSASPKLDDAIPWSPEDGFLEPEQLNGVDAFIHLAAESIDGQRWRSIFKDKLRASRIGPTRKLAEQLAALDNPPKVVLCASAIGFYGDRGSESIDEESSPGEGFLAKLCQDWEAALQPARDAGIRCHSLRFGVVLSPAGGALARMLPAFRMGAGGPIGSGAQFLSWIAIDDALNAIRHALSCSDLPPAINLVAPESLPNRAFGKVLGDVLCRPAFFPLPGFAARLAFGEMAQELLLSGAKVQPKALLESGFRFRQPTLAEALKYLLGRPPFLEVRPGQTDA